ncbi:MAG: YwiC-like family protein [Chloroflexota bacterium]
MRIKDNWLRKNIAFPQDHGSWVFILSPLIIGLFIGKRISTTSIIFVIAAMMAFLIRQPLVSLIKAYSGRRPKKDIQAAWFWILIYGSLILVFSMLLLFLHNGFILYLAIPAVPVFGWHLYLVSKRDERRRVVIEILATGVLGLVAPATYWIGNGSYSPIGWLLWVLVWFQTATSIVYAYLRLEQRQWTAIPDTRARISSSIGSISSTSFNLLISFFLGNISLIPKWVWIAFLVQFIESIYGSLYPAIGKKPVSIGVRQMIISVLFTIIFIFCWR